jgi:hypothetical protein
MRVLFCQFLDQFRFDHRQVFPRIDTIDAGRLPSASYAVKDFVRQVLLK